MFTIRELTSEDLEPVVEIIQSYVPEDGVCAKRYYLKYLENMQKPDPKERNYVAVDDRGKVLGVIGFEPDKYGTQGVLWLNWFYVESGSLGKGIGLELFTHLLSAVKALRARCLCLDTSSDPVYARAAKFYSQAGFELCGCLKNYYGSGEDMLIYSLALQESH